MKLSERMTQMTPSATSMLVGKIAEKRAAGADIISFNAGEPDFLTPQPVVDACCKALRDGKTRYENVGGVLPLRQAICEKLAQDNGLHYESNQICVSTGAKQALFNAVMALCGSGDEVIIPTPCWVSYVEMVKLAGGVPVLVKTNPNYSLSVDNIAQAITGRTKLVLINTPNNPTGAVYSADALRQLGQLTVEKDLFVISDEVYEKLVYGQSRHVSIASLDLAFYPRTVVINGMSKAYSMTGWRIGYSAASAELTKAMTGFQSHVSSNSTSFVQWASIAALHECADAVETMRQEFERRRDYMLERMAHIPGVHCQKPDGAFYLMPDVSAYIGKCFGDQVIDNSGKLCEFLLEQGGLAVVPGDAFFMPNTIRFAYSTSLELIKEGMDRLEHALALLK